jgi:endogenous inhibitor of DNA gyrase (YacG/DUF329 family)
MPEPPHPPVNDNAPRPRCPICGKPTAAAFKPFCSQRCKDVDLHRWFSGRYVTPAVEAEGESDAINAGEETPRRK